MPTITITDKTFRALQSRARPLIDTVDDVIQRLLKNPASGHEAMQNPPIGELEPWSTWPRANRVVAPNDSLSLTHTRLLRAYFPGVTDVTKWNDLLRACIRVALERGQSVEAIDRVAPVNVRSGRQSGNGYSYMADVNVSAQGVAADVAWRSVVGIAKLLSEPVAAMFEWRDKENAAFRGETGLIVFKP